MIDNQNLQPAAVIISVNRKGEILPLYFQYAQTQYKIESAMELEVKDGSSFWQEYRCRYTDNGYERHLTLAYNVSSGIWYIKLNSIA